MCEATNAESFTDCEELEVSLKTMVKRNIPHTNKGVGTKSILLYSIH